MNRQYAAVTLLAVLFVGLVQLGYYLPKLPDPVASHFDFQGRANGFLGKSSFAYVTLGLQVGFTAFWFTLAWLLQFIPSQLINIPRREYWLAPNRRDSTLAYVANWLLWFAAGTQAFFVGLNQLVIGENLEGATMAWFPVLMAVYLVSVVAAVVLLQLHFYRTTTHSQDME